MRKVIYLFAVALTAAFLSGCAKDKAIDNSGTSGKNPGNRITVTATIASDWQGGPETKIGLVDLGGGQSVKLTWSAGDCIAMYGIDGNLAAKFELAPTSVGSKSGTFVSVSGDIEDNSIYTVVYPDDGALTLSARNCSIDMAFQQGDGTADHLSDLCYMRANYTHTEGNTVNFALEFAMLTVVISTPDGYNVDFHGEPRSLTVTNGTSRSTLRIGGVSDLANVMTANMLIEPMSGANRPLAFELECCNSNGASRVFLMSTTTSVDYEAGKRYTADLSGTHVLSLASDWWLVDFSSSDYPAEDTWIINDAISSLTPLAEFDGLKDALQSASNENRSIRLVMPNASEIPNADNPSGETLFYGREALESISLPQVTVIGEFAFEDCSNLTSLNLPKVEEVKEGAFSGCSSINSINLPKAETIGESAFAGCSGLETISLPEATELASGAFWACDLKTANFPKVTTVGEEVFVLNTHLESVNLPEASEIGSLAFSECSGLISVSLPKAVSLGTEGTFNGCTSLTSLEIATQSTGITVTPTNLFANGVNLSNVTLTIGTAESASQGTDTSNNMWRGYGPFNEIIVK